VKRAEKKGDEKNLLLCAMLVAFRVTAEAEQTALAYGCGISAVEVYWKAKESRLTLD
jgi:hypothetical protein